jgi:hypothetical protein
VSSRPPNHVALDFPPLSVRWEGLVVVLDATTLNTALRKVMLRVPEVKEILVEPEDGRLGLTISLKRRRIPLPLRSHLGSISLKDGFLGFHVEDFTAFGFLPIPNWLLGKIVARMPEGVAFFYPEERIVVLNLTSFLPEELSVNVREVVCENGEMRLVFGPGQYRLDQLIDDIGKSPFDDD